jgi:hypothetical protein
MTTSSTTNFRSLTRAWSRGPDLQQQQDDGAQVRQVTGQPEDVHFGSLHRWVHETKNRRRSDDEGEDSENLLANVCPIWVYARERASGGRKSGRGTEINDSDVPAWEWKHGEKKRWTLWCRSGKTSSDITNQCILRKNDRFKKSQNKIFTKLLK